MAHGFYGERLVKWFGWEPQQSHADHRDRVRHCGGARGSDADALGVVDEPHDGAGKRSDDAAAVIRACPR